MISYTEQTLALPSSPARVSRIGELAVGTILSGRRRYSVQELIHCTSLNAVYVAIDLSTQQPVIIKQRCHQPQVRQHSGSGAYLQREGMVLDLLAQISIPAPRRLEIFTVEDHIYLVLSYAVGVTLETLRSGGRLHEHQTIDYMLDICWIVRHLHDIGLVHHDIKPANCLVQVDGSVLLIDYGSAEHIRPHGAILPPNTGTPAFMSAEQAAGEARVSDDIFALGMTLACLTPRPSLGLSRIIQRATAPVEQRYTTILDLQRDLARLRQHKRWMQQQIQWMQQQIYSIRTNPPLLLRLLVVVSILFGLVLLR